MPLTRRNFIAAAAAVAAIRPARAGTYSDLRAEPGTAQLAPPDYDPTPIWGYGGDVPGPVIRVPQGGRVTRRLVNRLPEPTSVHWHGIRIANAMDGVPGMTQQAVAPGWEQGKLETPPPRRTGWWNIPWRAIHLSLSPRPGGPWPAGSGQTCPGPGLR